MMVDLKNLGLTTLPPEIGNLSQLEGLDVSDNPLSGFLPSPQGLYRDPFRSVDWRPDGTQVLTASDDNVVCGYDWPLREKKPPRELVAGQNSITGLAWNAEGTKIVSTSEDVTTGIPVMRLRSPQPRLNSVDWNSLNGSLERVRFTFNHRHVHTFSSFASHWNTMTVRCSSNRVSADRQCENGKNCQG